MYIAYMSLHRYACMYACVPNLYSNVTVHIIDKSLSNMAATLQI